MPELDALREEVDRTIYEFFRRREKYLDVEGAADYLGLSPTTIRSYVQTDDIRHAKVGTRIIFDVQDLDSWIESNKRGGTSGR